MAEAAPPSELQAQLEQLVSVRLWALLTVFEARMARELEPLGLTPEVFTGGLSKARRQGMLEALASGEVPLVWIMMVLGVPKGLVGVRGWAGTARATPAAAR